MTEELPAYLRAWNHDEPKQAAEQATEQATEPDPVDHPKHYVSHPSGAECIEIAEHMNFCLGNAIKYIWRADLKGRALEDLRKARWYVDREILRRERFLTKET